MAKKDRLIFLLTFVVCLFIQVIPVIRSGIQNSQGISFWGPNGHDAVWHLSLINHIRNPLSIDMPIFAGEKLQNYHPFFDILLAFLSKITSISSSFWLFQLFPLISASLFLYLSFRLGWSLTRKFTGGMILMLLNTANNSFGWLVSLIRFGSLNGESLFWAMQSPSNQLNPPFALSILLLTILILILINSNDVLSCYQRFWIFLILTLLPVIKVYAAVPAFIIFSVYVLKSRRYFLTLLISAVSALFVFLQYNSAAASFLLFRPFWFANSLLESPDRLYLPQIASMRYSLESTGLLGPRLILIYLLSLTAFIVGNLAWRTLSVLDWLKHRNWLNMAIFISSFLAILIPSLFIQSGTSWNTIQFFYYALFLLNLPLCRFLTTPAPRYLTVIIMLSLLLPMIGSLPSSLGSPAPTYLPAAELEALTFLSTQPPGIVLTYPYDKFAKTSFTRTPIPLYAYETTSYVSAYSRQTTYLEDEMNLANSGYDWSGRRQQALDFFAQQNPIQDRGFLTNNRIDYIYLTGLQRDKVNFADINLSLVKIFENPASTIYRVQR